MSSDPTMTFPATQAPPESPLPPPPAAPPADRNRSRDHLFVVVWSVVLAVVAFAPILTSRGVVLRGAMVFVPREYVTGAWLGLDGWVVGSVPADFLTALATVVVPGDIVQKAILLGILVLAGTGVGALLADLGLVARLVGVTFFIWNPFVYERLLIGDWTLLIGYACLPWIAWAARRVTIGSIGEIAPVVVFIALAGVASPLGGMLGVLLAVLILARRDGRSALLVLVAGIVVNLPWIIPGLFRPGGPTGTTQAVDAYSANAETPLGVIGSLLTLGGVWDPAAYVPGRDNLIITVLALVVTLAALAGIALAAARWDPGTVTAIAIVAVIGLVLAVLGGVDATRSVIESLVDDVPGGGVLADGHAWLAPLALLLAVGFGALAGLVATLVGERAGAALVAVVGVVAVAIPIALMPSFAFAADGALDDIRYPGDWWDARLALEQRPAPIGTLVLPLEGQRTFTWNDDRWSLDPALYFFPGPMIVDDQREVNGVTVPGRDPRIEAIRAAQDGTPEEFIQTLADNGVDTVVIERRVGSRGAPRGTEFGEQLHTSTQLVAYAMPDDVTITDLKLDGPPSLLVIILDILAALVAIGALVAWIVFGRVPRRDPEVEVLV